MDRHDHNSKGIQQPGSSEWMQSLHTGSRWPQWLPSLHVLCTSSLPGGFGFNSSATGFNWWQVCTYQVLRLTQSRPDICTYFAWLNFAYSVFDAIFLSAGQGLYGSAPDACITLCIALCTWQESHKIGVDCLISSNGTFCCWVLTS